MIRNEDNASLQLQDADGRFYLLMKSSLVSVQRKAEDPMPVDYGQRLSGAELDDLVGYILRGRLQTSAERMRSLMPGIEGLARRTKSLRGIGST